MPYNFHAGWGRVLADSVFTKRPSTGRKFIVMASSNGNWERYTEMLPGHPEGDVISIHPTISDAVSAASNYEDDVIYVAAAHTETITAAAALVINKSGVSIVGLGNDDNRPRIDFDTATTADIDVNGADVTFENIKFNLTGIDLLTGPLDVNARNCTFKDCEIVIADDTNSALVGIVTDANASGLKLIRTNLHGTTNTGAATGIRIVGGNEHLIEDSIIDGHFNALMGGVS